MSKTSTHVTLTFPNLGERSIILPVLGEVLINSNCQLENVPVEQAEELLAMDCGITILKEEVTAPSVVVADDADVFSKEELELYSEEELDSILKKLKKLNAKTKTLPKEEKINLILSA